MDTNGQIELLDRISGPAAAPAQAAGKAGSLGRVVAVAGSQVVAHFDPEALSDDDGITVGSLVGIANGAALAIGTLCEICVDPAAAADRAGASGRIDLLGEIVAAADGESRFQAGIGLYPRLGNPVLALAGEELQVVFGLAEPSCVEIGRLQQNAAIPAAVNVDEMVRKHFAIVGSTGSGKSSGLALVLNRIIETRADLRMLLIDVHNEYGQCFGERAQVFGPVTLRLPFWLFNFDEIVQIVFGPRNRADQEIALLAELIPHAKSEYARARSLSRASYKAPQAEGGRYTVDTPVPYRIEDVIAAAESRMGKLENGDFAIQYQRLLMRLNAVRNNPRYAFIFDDGGDGSDTMVDILNQLLRLSDDERPISVVQLAGFPAETMEVIVSVLFRLAFEFGVWSDGCSPLLIVCEEAHNYANADRSVGFRAARDGLARIAKEGRKHGVFLGLVTQRPHQLDLTLISQCSTVFAMRLGHEDDQRIVRAAVSDSASRQLAFLPSLGTREALVIGAGVPTVMRLRFAELPQQFVPRSQAGWSGNFGDGRGLDEQKIAAVVARWRGSPVALRPSRTPPAADPAARADELTNWSAPISRR